MGDWWGIPNRCLPNGANPKQACRPGQDEARLVAGAVGWEVDPVSVVASLPLRCRCGWLSGRRSDGICDGEMGIMETTVTVEFVGAFIKII